jgi:hypothetical protein
VDEDEVDPDEKDQAYQPIDEVDAATDESQVSGCESHTIGQPDQRDQLEALRLAGSHQGVWSLHPTVLRAFALLVPVQATLRDLTTMPMRPLGP